MIPGSNLLSSALSVLAAQCFQYYAFSERTTQSNGQYLSTYLAPQSARGSVQPVPRSLYQEYGLDFQRYYLKLFLSKSVTDISRDTSGDMFAFEGKYFQALSTTPWRGIDGWLEVLAVQVPNAPTVA